MNENSEDTSQPVVEASVETATAAAPARSRASGWLWGLVIVLGAGLAIGAWFVHQQLRQAERGDAEWRETVEALRAEIAALDRELDANRERQRQIEARMGDSAAGLRVVREEVLGMAERATRVEEAIAALSQARQDAALTLRLDDLELLLQQAQLRSNLLADHAAAERALAHAAALLAQIDDPAYSVLRVPLEQERAALAELGPDPRPSLRQQVSGLIDILPGLAWQQPADALPEDAPAVLKLFDRLVKVRRVSDSQMALSPLERASRRASIELTLALALAALETGDEAAWKHHLKRAREDIVLLFDPSASAVTAAVQILDEAIRQPLRPDGQALGTTLRELRAMRATRAVGAGALPNLEPAPQAEAVERP
ncbi:hypothetical protein [Pseudomarimonas salicorniae]|uniref:Uroporphyrin-3 C-methyltransferase n=1 Tax=Pseudomarimonas salicorniae TaxID=2933270 RepID=A0ABT0GGC5_9GAMM|nr:hypothetical protein [Lysobacter sp. CAU 1642]MCK7593586.1 hypothetical protein [Lysobacter sp. CAU 1642]